MPSWPRSRARKPEASPQPHRCGRGHGTPQPRESGPARHPHTGPGAEGGGGWPMHATAQPWHAEGQPLPTGALRCLLSPRERPGTPPATRPGGCHGSSPVPPWQHSPCQDVPCSPARRWPAPAPSRRYEVLRCLSQRPAGGGAGCFCVRSTAPRRGIDPLCPDLIDQLLRGSLPLQDSNLRPLGRAGAGVVWPSLFRWG